MTTPVRQNITTATRDDSRTTLDIVNLATGEVTLAGVVPETPVVSVFGTTRFNTNPRQMVVDSAGTTVYAITLSGLSVVSLTPSNTDTRPSDQHRRPRHRKLGGRYGELPPRFLHHDQRLESGDPRDRRHHPPADRPRWLLRDLRRYLGPAALDRERPDSGADPGHAARGHARRGSPVARHRAAERSGNRHGASVGKLSVLIGDCPVTPGLPLPDSSLTHKRRPGGLRYQEP